MICKETTMRVPGASRLGGIARYISNDQGNPIRVSAVRVYGSAVADPDSPDGGMEGAVFEFEMVQKAAGTTAKKKTAHLVLSLGEGEDMPDDKLFALQDELMVKMGWGNAQRIVAIHRDTDTLHAHIALNCIRPDTGKKIEMRYSWLRLRKVCEELERKYGLAKTGHNAPDKTAEQGAERLPSAAADMEAATGQQSAVSYLRETLAPALAAANNWDDVHRACRECGINVEAKGQGLVFVTKDGINVKASSVGREFGKAKLEKKLGTFTKAPAWIQPVKPRKTYAKKPIVPPPHTKRNLWEEFCAGKTENSQTIYAEIRKTAQAKKQDKATAWTEYRYAMVLVRRMATGRDRALATQNAKKSYEEQKRIIDERYEQVFSDLNRRKAKSGWIEWLRANAERGDVACLAALRDRAVKLARRNLSFNWAGIPDDRRDEFIPNATIVKVTRQGLVLYRYKRSTVSDLGDRIGCQGLDEEAVRTCLEVAKDRFKQPLTLTGSQAWIDKAVEMAAKCDVELHDPQLESRRRIIAQKLFPHRVPTISKSNITTNGAKPVKPMPPKKEQSSGFTFSR